MSEYFQIINTKYEYLIENFLIESLVHGVAINMLSKHFINPEVLEDIFETKLTREKMTKLLKELLRQEKQIDFTEVYNTLLIKLREFQRTDVIVEMERSLSELFKNRTTKQQLAAGNNISLTSQETEMTQQTDTTHQTTPLTKRNTQNTPTAGSEQPTNKKRKESHTDVIAHGATTSSASCAQAESKEATEVDSRMGLGICDEDGKTPLIRVCEANDQHKVSDILSVCQCTINKTDINGCTAGMFAFAHCNDIIIRLLYDTDIKSLHYKDNKSIPTVWYVFTGGYLKDIHRLDTEYSTYNHFISEVRDACKNTVRRWDIVSVSRILTILDNKNKTSEIIKLFQAALLLSNVTMVKFLVKRVAKFINVITADNYLRLAECAIASNDESVVSTFFEKTINTIDNTTIITDILRACLFVNNPKITDVIVSEYIDLEKVHKTLSNAISIQFWSGSISLWLKIMKPDLNLRDEDENTLFMLMCEFGSNDSVAYLLNGNLVDFNVKNKNGCSPFMVSCMNPSTNVPLILIKAGKYAIEERDNDGRTNMIYATNTRNRDVISLILDESIYVNAIDNNSGNTALHLLCAQGEKELTEILLTDPGINVNAVSKGTKDTPLHMAIKSRNTNVVYALLNKARLNVNYINRSGESALYLACHIGLKDAVKALLTVSSVEVNLPNKIGHTPLYEAGVRGDTSIIELLLKHPNVDVNFVENNGDPLLIGVSRGYNLGVVEMLLKHHDINVNLADKKGNTLLNKAIKNDTTTLVEILLKHSNVDVNLANNEGNTPLIEACQFEDESGIVEMLLKHSTIDANKSNNEGLTALMVARNLKLTNTVDQLLSMDAFMYQ